MKHPADELAEAATQYASALGRRWDQVVALVNADVGWEEFVRFVRECERVDGAS